VKTLSDHLADLSERSKHIENSLSAARDQNLELLAARHRALQATLARNVEHTGDEVVDKLKAPWRNARAAVERTLATVREDADERRAQKDLARAERHADHAEEEAASAVALAVVVLDQTEYAVAEAVLARAEADKLSAGTVAAGHHSGPVASA